MEPGVTVGSLKRLVEWKGPVDDAPWHVNDHTIAVGPDGTWHMYGIVWPDPGHGELDPVALGHSTAPTLHGPWRQEPSDFLLDRAAGETVLWAPHIVRDGDRFVMAYTAGGSDPTDWAISLAESDDLWTWRRLGPAFRDGYQARDPMLLRIEEESLWVMYYCATEPATGGHHVVAYRTSTDLRSWSEREIAFTDEHVGTEYGPTESPFVVAAEGRYLLLAGPRPYDPPTADEPNWEHRGYDGTDVFSSSTWRSWSHQDLLGHLPLHAPEVIRDSDDLYITHGGIGRGGLWLGRLEIHSSPITDEGNQE